MLACLLFALAAEAPLSAKPNVVVILADDLGYGDFHANNPERGKIPTPNMDRLAAEGMRFTDGHSSSGCCSPSRYALLAGRYHWRSRLQAGIVPLWGAPLIAPDRLTLGTLAQRHGYRTACVGKWHLGIDWPIAKEDRPRFQGLGGKAGGGGKVDTSVTDDHRAAWRKTFGQPFANGPTTRGFDEYFGTEVPNWPPYCFIENDRTVGVPSELLPAPNFVKNQASLQGPALPGWRLDAILPALADRAGKFIKESAARKQPFLLYLPLTAPHTPIAVDAAWRGKSALRHDYADFVMQTDAVLGQALDALRAAGAEGNTLVVFTSDNGCASYIGVPALEAAGHFPSGPLRGYKASAHEGGHRVPFVVRWPGVVKPGSVCRQLVHHADLLATFAALLNATLPENAGEDSFSMLPLLRGEDRPIRETAVSTACQGAPAFRHGPWKLILGAGGAGGVQLFNLDDDLAEANDLAATQPERVAELRAAFEALIRAGRSTPGATQKNDVAVVRYPRSENPGKAKGKAKAKAK